MISMGHSAIYIALIATLVAGYAYIAVLRGQAESLKLARFSLGLAATGIVIAMGSLLMLFLGHHFEVSYVYEYSSSDLSTPLLISALWAGQSGSLLLWTLLTAVVGIVLAFSSGKDEPYRMPFFLLAQLYLIVLLISKSPFAVLHGPIPTEGSGLNPLLQNIWMIIHPPFLFLGYALLAAPFAMALGSLLKRDFNDWITKLMPWAIIGWVALFAGIALGGYWAYETLGWGGFWGWDPVENSSLVPWLVLTALLHGLIIQRVTSSFHKTNYALAVLSYLLVLLATYLTRSGILGDTSVHSFSQAGSQFNQLMIGFPCAFAVIALFLYRRVARSIRTQPAYTSLLSKGFLMVASVVVLLALAVAILCGTVAPIMMAQFGHSFAVAQSYYNRVSTPAAVIICVLMALAPLIGWKPVPPSEIKPTLIPPLYFSLLVCAIAWGCGVHSWVWLICTGAAAFAISGNSIRLYHGYRDRQPLRTGAQLAHIGAALLVVGAFVSTVYQREQIISVATEHPATAFGYQLNLQSLHNQPTTLHQIKRQLNLMLRSDRQSYNARMTLTSTANGWVNSPAIHRTALYDLYLAPTQLESHPSVPTILLKLGVPVQIGRTTWLFKGFKMFEHGQTANQFRVGAVITVTDPQGVHTLIPSVNGQKQPIDEPSLPDQPRIKVELADLMADSQQVALLLVGMPAPSAAVRIWMQAIYKPGIGVVWLGAVLIVLGGLLAAIRRSSDLRRQPTPIASPEGSRNGSGVAPAPTKKRKAVAPIASK
ncbi:MAG: cytochrome c biogenesis protein CcsA [Armatimonadetes bacterium]|nr:cytochrome c biogenesis protein CcsA [Armatimonadota bacterium]